MVQQPSTTRPEFSRTRDGFAELGDLDRVQEKLR